MKPRRTNCYTCDNIIPKDLRRFCSKECKNKYIRDFQFEGIYKNRKVKTLAKKTKLIKLFGGKCKYCDYNRCIRALSFHHVDPKLKSFAINITNLRGTSWDKILEEAKKTELVCVNCHRRLHFKNYIQKKQGEIKKNLVDIKGGQCEKCGYKECLAALDFHHTDPKNKKRLGFGSSTYNFDIQDILHELNTCILLCANCHYEEHYNNENSVTEEEIANYSKKQRRMAKCLYCDKEYHQYVKRLKFCSTRCSGFAKKGVKWQRKQKPIRRMRSCKYCKNDFYEPHKETKFCSRKCAGLSRRKK